VKGLLLVYLVTAIGTVGALRYPLIGLYIYVGFAVLRPQEIWGWAGDFGSISLLVGCSMVIGWALQGFGSWQFGRGRAVVVLLLSFIAWFAVAGELGVDPSNSRHVLIAFAKVVVPVLVGLTMLKTQQQCLTLLWVIVLTQGFVAFEMNSEYLLTGRNRAQEGFGAGDNNFFGLSLVTVIGPAIALAITTPKWYAKLLAAGTSALILHTILLTFSRGAFLGLVVMAVTAFVLMPKRPRNLAAIAASVGIAIWLTGPELAERYWSTFNAEESRDGSAQSRVELWVDCLEVIGDYPVFGIGSGNWGVIAPRYGWPQGKSAHSVWIEMAADAGIPAALLLFSFFAVAALKLWPMARARPSPETRQLIGIATGGVLAVAGFIVTGQFVTAPALEVPYYVLTAAVAVLRLPLPRPAVVAMTAPPRAYPIPVPAPLRRPMPSPRMRKAT
jgi:O-antigen ligase